jgi:hypothetical protein
MIIRPASQLNPNLLGQGNEVGFSEIPAKKPPKVFMPSWRLFFDF